MITFSIFTELEKLSAVFGNQVNYQSLSGGEAFCPVFTNWRNFMTHGRGFIVFSWYSEPECDLDHANILSFGHLLFVTHHCMSGSAESETGTGLLVNIGPCHKAPTSLSWVTQPNVSHLMDGTGPDDGSAQIFKSQSMVSVRLNIGQWLRQRPPCHQCRAHPSWDRSHRVTAMRFLPPTALHYHILQSWAGNQSEEGDVRSKHRAPGAYWQWLSWTLDITWWGADTMMSSMRSWHMRDTISHNLLLVMFIRLQHTCSTLHYTAVHCITSQYRCYCRPAMRREQGKVLVSFTDSRRHRVHFWVASNKQ